MVGEHVLVLGAGAVGTASAWYLLKAGYRVRSSSASPDRRWRRAGATAA